MTDFEPFKDDEEAMDWIEDAQADLWDENPPKIWRKPMLGLSILLTVVVTASILALVFR